MQNAPTYDLDLAEFWQDPYPELKRLRADFPIAYVPQLDATLITRRDDIFQNEKRVEVFSSDQPDGLMQRLMGQNMMRKDGKDHMVERKAIYPSVSPKTVTGHWQERFQSLTNELLDDMFPLGQADMVRDIARRISGEVLKAMTGLTNITWEEMDRVSQGMIDGCANYVGDPEVEARCHDCTSAIDDYISDLMPVYAEAPDHSLLSVQLQKGLPEAAVRANVKLSISGGQNELRDALAGLVWALLTHPEQLDLVRSGQATWKDAFDEYCRWISPIGMSPRRIARREEVHDVILEPGDKVFFMFGSGNRDERHFSDPDVFNIAQDSSAAMPFGAGPHYCAGAVASKCMIAEVFVPELFDRFTGLRLTTQPEFGGWAFRGPLSMPVQWDVI